MKYRKKPVVIEAEQFKMDDASVTDFAAGAPVLFMEYEVKHDGKAYFLEIPTLEGTHRANEGDWIITGVKGERYPCKPDIFEATYEQVPTDMIGTAA